MCACLSVGMCTWLQWPWKQEEGIGDPRIGVRGGCDSIFGIWEPSPGPLQVLQVLLTAEPSLPASHCCPRLSLVKHPLCVRYPLVAGSQKIPEEQCLIHRQGKKGTMGDVGWQEGHGQSIPQQFGARIGLGRLCLSVSKSSDTRGPEVSVMGLKEWLVFLSWSMLTWPRTHRW